MALSRPELVADEDPLVEPLDEHNRTLLSNVHPPDWVNPQPAGRYNLVVIGAGTAGLVTAAGAAGLGAKVALVERGLMGGDCLNIGCVPSKALIRAARAAAAVRDAPRFGIVVAPGTQVDFGRVMERMRRLRAQPSATCSTSLPKFSPRKSFSSVSGKVSMPATTSSRLFIRPSRR